MEEISALVSTFFVFISGVIPQLLFKRFTKEKHFSGWDKIKIDNKIKEAVRAYILAKMEKIPFPYEDSEPPTRGGSRPSDTGGDPVSNPGSATANSLAFSGLGRCLVSCS